MHRNISLVVALSVGVAILSAGPARGDIPVFDPANYAQNVLIQANTLKTTVDQATAVAYQLRQLELEIQSLKNIPSGVWGAVQSDIAQLRAIVREGQGIDYTDRALSREFSSTYPGYTTQTDYEAAYAQWSQNSLAGLQTALSDAGVQNDQLDAEATLLGSLTRLSDRAQGPMEGLQIANMIAVQQVAQLQKLRQLQMAEIQAQVGYLATQQQLQSTQYAALKSWLDSSSMSPIKF